MKRLRITVEGKTYEVEVEAVGEEASASQAPAAPRPAARAANIAPPAAPAAPAPSAPKAGAQPGDIPSPLSGTVVSVDVKVGQEVAAGDPLITLEAMKMNTIVNAPNGGTVSAIHIQPGQSVEEGLPLLALS